MFHYINCVLHAENVPVEIIAKEVGTPCYIYSNEILTKNFKDFDNALKKFKNTISYSIKANSNLGIVKTIASLGGGADVVSAGEMCIALKAGIPANKIVFSGVGKTKRELEEAIKNEILQINAESEAEVNTINHIALKLGKKANIALRVNPDVDAKTHVKITTGKKENKFGVDWDIAKDLYIKASKMEGLNVVGIAMHIGSQLLDLDPFRLAFTKMADMVSELEKEGIILKNLDLGGGLGINYNVELPPTKEAYAQVIEETLGKFNKHIIIEPGRSIIGEAAILISEVIFTKDMGSKHFIIVDAGMNDLMRPAMYDSWHTIVPVVKKGLAPITADIVGPICESSDTFAKDRIIEPVKQGELVAMMSAGAYGSSMSSVYNFRPLVPEVMVNKNAFTVVRKRTTYEEMLSGQTIPDWLKK
ncbi:Diaminopimelate decarboxylase [Elusimicrobium minutum Pei191]|uniref:Diaminopimelate decarboxylase n=1 Tax=Elusimicrobium minutum (strain Pei191) TaxID=445932 RepID=B2KCK2_ELUMP|nr:diaminopimelate decarboxylase [Elusimicrobium minutum]ACC98248.1 Diaminopimelate decarboxylase [Elusimicrobium minutum Pei191]